MPLLIEMRYFAIIILLPLLLISAEPDTMENWKPKPALAAGLSIALPGAGQIYNRSYWKAPIVMALEGYTAWVAIDANSKMTEAEERGIQYAEGSDEYQEAKSDWENARELRNTHIWLFAGTVFLSAIDAYVDAHLYDWTREMAEPIEPEETALQISPYINNRGAPGMALTFKFYSP